MRQQEAQCINLLKSPEAVLWTNERMVHALDRGYFASFFMAHTHNLAKFATAKDAFNSKVLLKLTHSALQYDVRTVLRVLQGFSVLRKGCRDTGSCPMSVCFA